ncbi:MAG: ferrochelatase [Alphaproteobacteria bacterium]|nr:MAG: ferrochelatase [Alphaproteobacteria bacterium]
MSGTVPGNSISDGLGRTGVLLVNLGTPDAPTPRAVRRYLREFLGDRRVVELSPWLWRPLLELVILPLRARTSAAAYRKIWLADPPESPLRAATRALAEKLQAAFAGDELPPRIDWAMRYGRPTIAARIDALLAAGCERLLVCPLYPQYAAATTGSVCDAVFRALEGRRIVPALRILPPYPDHPAYIAALADSVRAHVAAAGWAPERLVLSFHGLPQAQVDAGDPYRRQCEQTADALRAALGLDAERAPLAFQSRFGPAAWLVPATDAMLRDLARQGVRDLMVVTPGFATDCLETLEEIALGGRDIFLAAGGRRFDLVPCLNQSDAHVGLLASLIREEGAGWLG